MSVVGKSALAPVAAGIGALLDVSTYSGASGVSPGGIFNGRAPQGTTTFPYSEFTLREVSGGGETFGKGGKELTLRLRIWDDYEGDLRLDAAVSEAARLLHKDGSSASALSATGFTTLLVWYEGAMSLPEVRVSEQQIRGKEATFRILVDQT